MTPSEWAETYRVLDRRQTARPGPWRNVNTPYSVGVMNACGTRGVTHVAVMKSSQAGISEAIRNAIGWRAHLDPDPVMLVLPDEDTAKRIMRERYGPLFTDTKPLADLATDSAHDKTQVGVVLSNGFNLRIAWSGSPSSLASDPIRTVICDEVDKYQAFAGREASPVDLAEARTKTYESNRLCVYLSSPTTREGTICQLFESMDVQLYFRVPCPVCGRFDRLLHGGLKWATHEGEDRQERARRIRKTKDVWYECRNCKGQWRDDKRTEAVRRGVWASDDMAAAPDFDERARQSPMGAILDPIGFNGAGRVGFQISDLYCDWVRFHELAAEFLTLDPMVYVTNRLGEPTVTTTVKTQASIHAEKSRIAKLPPNIVPDWCTALLATVDVQRDRFYFVVRAWGPGDRSARVSHGQLQTFDDLVEILLNGSWPIEATQQEMRIHALGIDSGDGVMTAEVYRFARQDARIRPMKGASTKRKWGSMTWNSQVTHTPRYGMPDPIEVSLTLFMPDYYKDLVSSWIAQSGGDDGEKWALNTMSDDDYNRQMASEHKIKTRKGNQSIEVWTDVVPGAPNHFWDCEIMQAALAANLNAALFPRIRRDPAAQQQQPIRPPTPPSRPIQNLTNRSPFRRKY